MGKHGTTIFTAHHRAQDAASHLLLAAWANDCHGQNWHRTYAIERLTAAADVLGYDLVKCQPEVPAEPAMTGIDAAVRDLLRATADAGYMRAADYVNANEDPPAVTDEPGFDGRDITMRDKP